MKTLLKYSFFSISFLLAAHIVFGQSDYNPGVKVNRMTTRSILVPVINESAINSLPENSKITSSVFQDGTGKTIQMVIQNNNNSDVIKPIVYDEFDRIVTDKLPYVSGNNHQFKRNVYSQQDLWNNAQFPEENGYSYSTTSYDDLTLKREVTFQETGKDSYDANSPAFSSTSTALNTAAEGVRIWTITAPEQAPSSNTIWPDAKLYVRVIKDRDGNISRQYFDKTGKLILEKQNAIANPDINQHTGWKCTYYIYDAYNRLSKVLTPKLVEHAAANGWNIPQDNFYELASWFRYDHRNRIMEKKEQGVEPVRVVFDNQDRIVLTQDGELRHEDYWMLHKYDVNGRLILKGLYRNSNSLSATQLQSVMEEEEHYDAALSLLNNKIVSHNFSTTTNIADIDILMINRYDDYTTGGIQFEPDVFTGSNTNITLTKTKETYGLSTESYSRLFEGANMTGNWEKSVIFYDRKSRPVQLHNINATGGHDVVSNNYDFTGKIISTITSLNNSNTGVDVAEVSSFQHYIYKKNLVESIFQKFDRDPYYRKIGQFEHDHFGRAIKEFLGTVEQRIYQYNMMGQMVAINKDYYEGANMENYFGEKITFDVANNKSYMPAQVLWRQKGSEDVQRSYTYIYDHLKRLTQASYSQSENGNSWSNTIEDYSMTNMTYDLNGNIQSLKRWGSSNAYNNPFLMDDLTYGYLNNGNSNRLHVVSDAVSGQFGLGEFVKQNQTAQYDYSQNDNGHTIMDANRDINLMTYGIFSKPTNVNFRNGNAIQFNYGANFSLKSKVINDQVNGLIKRIDYIGGAEYVNNKLNSIAIANGSARIIPVTDHKGDTTLHFEYDYHIKDHSGNVKSVVTESPDANWYVQPAANIYVPVSHQLSAEGQGFTRQRRSYLATFEMENDAVENILFEHIDDVRDTKRGSTSTTDQLAANLHPDYAPIAAVKMIRVFSGDKIEASSEYYYQTENGHNNSGGPGEQDVLDQVMSALTQGGTTAIISDGATNNLLNNIQNNTWNSVFQNIALNDQHNQAKPNAFLNVLFFDERMQLRSDLSHRMQVITADSWDYLSQEIDITRNGYVMIFVNNQSSGDVRFDNVNLSHTKGALIQESHYYPYGLTITSAPYSIVNENNQLFLGKQLEHGEFGDKGLDLYNFDHRMYDPQIGRFHAADPFALLAPSWSPYRYGFNNPVMYSDPSGLYEEGEDDPDFYEPTYDYYDPNRIYNEGDKYIRNDEVIEVVGIHHPENTSYNIEVVDLYHVANNEPVYDPLPINIGDQQADHNDPDNHIMYDDPNDQSNYQPSGNGFAYVLVMHDNTGALWQGHTAIGIVYSDGTARYMSKDGLDKIDNKGNNLNYADEYHSSYKSLMNSPSTQRYTEFLTIGMTDRQAKSIMLDMQTQIRTHYDLWYSNCMTAVATAIFLNNNINHKTPGFTNIPGFNPAYSLLPRNPNWQFNHAKQYGYDYFKR